MAWLIDQCVQSGLKRSSCEKNVRNGQGGDPQCSDYRVLPDYCKTSTPDMNEIEKKEQKFAAECRRKGGEMAASALKCMYRNADAPGGWDDKRPTKAKNEAPKTHSEKSPPEDEESRPSLSEENDS